MRSLERQVLVIGISHAYSCSALGLRVGALEDGLFEKITY